jgi:ribosomal protein L23
LKLRGAKKEEGAQELSKPLIAKELNKDATFEVKVAKVETWAFPQAESGWRILVDKEKVRMGSTAIDTDLIVYVRQDLKDVVDKVKKGQKIQVTGRLSRCDLTAKDSPILHIDVQAASIITVGK